MRVCILFGSMLIADAIRPGYEIGLLGQVALIALALALLFDIIALIRGR